MFDKEILAHVDGMFLCGLYCQFFFLLYIFSVHGISYKILYQLDKAGFKFFEKDHILRSHLHKNTEQKISWNLAVTLSKNPEIYERVK